ncbi:thiolase, N-terminal domain protein [Mycobacterium xenopi 4042]|uniref:Thiolase, N-terminal domain protein n=1 Tax=Mycobacterium xenopi 4042 TaxID=1299334 RepID=X8DDB2_MYCXE|nr:thiolase, N-terminal domain protein [Mycobacterium xenopi 4042]
MSACSSGSEAIAHAWRQIILGDADIAVCGGVEGGIEALPIAAFSMMRAMSTRNDDPEGASRPFDKDRDGFVFGEAGRSWSSKPKSTPRPAALSRWPA